MSFELMLAVLHSDLPAMQKAVAMPLAEATNGEQPERGSWLSNQTLAKRAGMDERTVQRNLKALVLAGCLSIERGAGPRGTNIYRLNLRHSATPGATPPPAECHPSPGATPPLPPAQRHPGGGTAPPEPGIEPGIEPGKEPGKEPGAAKTSALAERASPDLFAASGSAPGRRVNGRAKLPRDATPAGFAEFWAAYPRHDAKRDAIKAWNALKSDPELHAEIIAAVRRDARKDAWQRDGGKFIPYAATWIRGERWQDERRAAPEFAVSESTGVAL